MSACKLLVFALLVALLVLNLTDGSKAEEQENKLEELDEMSQVAFSEPFEEEGDELTGDLKVFDDFCVMGRDYVFAESKRNTDAVAANAFAMLFGLVKRIGQGSDDIIRGGKSKVRTHFEHPESIIIRKEEAAADNNAEMQSETFIQAFKSIISATNLQVRKTFYKKLDDFQQHAEEANSLESLRQVCERVIDYRRYLDYQFEEYKKAAEQELGKLAYTMERVPCKTTTRVVRIAGLCELAKSVAPIVGKY